ncbi:hypothetical protein EDD16DRAFT_1560147 [Pisolithus croceorrhizus]|nr:hypothetical protein EDD16DRAFT_1560147 [Pisolithus croceorrhizus]
MCRKAAAFPVTVCRHFLCYYSSCLTPLSEMFGKKIGRFFPIRIRIPWRGDKSTEEAYDHSIAAGSHNVSPRVLNSNSFPASPALDPQPLTVVSPPRTSHATSSRNISDAIQMTLPVVQAVAEAIPVAGAPLKAAISGLLAVLQVKDRYVQNREDLNDLTYRLYNLSCHIANVPTAQSPFEEANRHVLIKVLEDTAVKLSKMQSCIPGSASLTMDIARCSNKINDYLIEFMALSQMQLHTNFYHNAACLQTQLKEIRSIMIARDVAHPSPTMATGCVIVVDATGREHNMLLDQCSSLDRLLAFLPGMLHQCQPDEAQIQQWCIDRGQYDFVIDNGINITRLTRDSDFWLAIEPGTKIIMRVITTEVVRRFTPRYRCRCGTWNYFEVEEAVVLHALEYGVIITCCHCQQQIQITGSKRERAMIKQGQRSQVNDNDGSVVEAKGLIHNFLTKQVDPRRSRHYTKPPSDESRAGSSYAYNYDPVGKCKWVVAGDSVCGAILPVESFPVHMREAHGVFGNDKIKFKCEWVGCGLQMNKESVGQHVAESHLLCMYTCIHCGQVFTRKDSLKSHLRRCVGEFDGFADN